MEIDHQGTRQLRAYLPILSWLPNYDRSWLSADVVAGLTLWGLVVPEAMAYAGIAGLPPQAGLYTLLAALLIYAAPRHVAAPGGAGHLGDGGLAGVVGRGGAAAGRATRSGRYQAYASAFVLVTGLVFLVAGLARLGFITQFLSKPVMDGFVTGLASSSRWASSTSSSACPKPDGNTVEKLLGIIRELPEANWVTFARGRDRPGAAFFLPRLNRKLPAGLVVLFGAIAPQHGAGSGGQRRCGRGRRAAAGPAAAVLAGGAAQTVSSRWCCRPSASCW